MYNLHEQSCLERKRELSTRSRSSRTIHWCCSPLPKQEKERDVFNMNKGRPLKIGITCYPSVGGSGVIATTLGIDLAQRGHEVHFISYDRPFRLPENSPRIYFHPVVINSYGLFKYPDYTLPLSVEMAR